MSRHLITLNSAGARAMAVRYIAAAPDGYRVEIKEGTRSLQQNAKMWAALTDIARQKEHCGRKYEPGIWKLIMMHALGREVQFVPSLDGKTLIPCNGSSSDLTKDEMSQLLDFIVAWGAQNGVTFNEPLGAAA